MTEYGCTIDGQPAMPILIAEHTQLVTRLAEAEAALDRVRALDDRWVEAGPPPLGVPLARWWDKQLAELHRALEQSAGTTTNNPAASSDTPARHIRVTATHPDEYTVNRFALNLADHIRAEFGDSIRMVIATDAREWEPADETATEAARKQT